MNILKPDQNLKTLHLYHSINKIMFPVALFSLGSRYLQLNQITPYLDYFNISNLAYHSYVSTSCIITDYIKVKALKTPFRLVNLNLHAVSCLGFYTYIYNFKYEN